MAFSKLMASNLGRGARIIVGLVLLTLGTTLGGAWWIVGVVGLVPLLAGIFDLCLLGPVLGQPLRGKEIRTPAS